MMIKNTHLLVLILILFGSCTNGDDSSNDFSFYHWKFNAEYTPNYKEALEKANTKKIYLHYFDIKPGKKTIENADGIYPTYVLRDVAKEYRNFKIIPVVYITNQVFKTNDLDITELVDRIKSLVDQMSIRHFEKEIKEIQIDCDWTESSKNKYFELLKALGIHFEIDATIRLHQIKFQDKTGVPPVKKGTLMLYNIGDLKNKQQNSILQSNIAEQYINQNTSYPLPLNIGLPLFSQTILFNKNDEIKIIKNTERELLENDRHFEKIDQNNFKIISDTLYKGFYLSKGYSLKIEEIKENEITSSYETIKQSKLITKEIIFYHLDDESISNSNFSSLIKNL